MYKLRHKYLLWVTALLLPLLTGCSSDDNDNNGSLIIDPVEDAQLSLGYEKGSRVEFRFTAEENWNASVDVDWATISPMTGQAGEQTINVITKSLNNTGSVREGHLTISTKSGKVTSTFKQDKTDIVNLEQQTYNVAAEGGELVVKFSSNIRGHKLLVVQNASQPTWIKGVKDANDPNDTEAGVGEGLQESEYHFNVLPNEAHKSRSVTFYIRIVNPNDYNEVYITSGVFTVEQAGLPVETSTDYSQHNTFKLLQGHTKGNGMPIVIMGDGFVDSEINSGRYESVMRQTMENLFTEEPVKSLREYFDVWQVTLVSKNNAFGTGYQTALSCKFQGNGSSRVEGDFNQIVASVKNVNDLQAIERLRDVLAVVIINTPDRAGTTNFAIPFDNVMSEFAIAYVPLIDNDPVGESFRSVLCHEALGHGLGKLLDEYAYEANNSNVPASTVETYRNLQTSYGWAQNVSFSATDVPWQHLLDDSRYQVTDVFGERLGIYEGACGYLHGAWRPTNDSMMFHNTNGFNAPSREAIYKHVMQVAMGEYWKYDVAKFIEFDQAHLPQPTATDSKSRGNIEDAIQMICIDQQPTSLAMPIIGR